MKEERESTAPNLDAAGWYWECSRSLRRSFSSVLPRSCPLVLPNASRQSATHLKEKQLRMRYIDDFVLCPGEQSEEKLPIDLRGCDITFESP